MTTYRVYCITPEGQRITVGYYEAERSLDAIDDYLNDHPYERDQEYSENTYEAEVEVEP